METRIVTVTLRGAAADRLRKAICAEQTDKPKRIDWTGFSRTLADEHK